MDEKEQRRGARLEEKHGATEEAAEGTEANRNAKREFNDERTTKVSAVDIRPPSMTRSGATARGKTGTTLAPQRGPDAVSSLMIPIARNERLIGE